MRGLTDDLLNHLKDSAFVVRPGDEVPSAAGQCFDGTAALAHSTANEYAYIGILHPEIVYGSHHGRLAEGEVHYEHVRPQLLILLQGLFAGFRFADDCETVALEDVPQRPTAVCGFIGEKNFFCHRRLPGAS